MSVLSGSELRTALGIANPPSVATTWQPVALCEKCHRTEKYGDDEGATLLQVQIGSRETFLHASVVIQYRRNETVLVCPENAALDDEDDNPLDPEVTTWIVESQAGLIKQNLEVTFDFKTQVSGSPHVTLCSIRPKGFPIAEGNYCFPPVQLSSLRWTHRREGHHELYLVTCGSDAALYVFKQASQPPTSLMAFFTSLRPMDGLLPPKNVVLDEAGRFHGILLDYHPASSLDYVLRTGATRSIPWTIKMAWACDIARNLASLHEQSVVWGDLKTSNIILCTDGRCRLIDYFPEGSTPAWYRSATEQRRLTAADDVEALGLVLWSLAMDAAELPWQEEWPSDAWLSKLEWRARRS
ncbi:Serine/threonine protein kinase [Mycena chlorophos]|uniref:Serine/threonine protein kinase n=1 Tax=Mycena chlorophos TaxID=658473 RepID=A0A8H6RY82_MYCCL|nr:Serine/threonine protein kinase [Mycena chlorophos]